MSLDTMIIQKRNICFSIQNICLQVQESVLQFQGIFIDKIHMIMKKSGVSNKLNLLEQFNKPFKIHIIHD